MKQPVIVAMGVGRNSVAVAIKMYQMGWRPDAILFANVGSEKEGTYEFIPVFNEWLRERDFPEITVVQYTPRRAPYRTLEGNMILNATLPGATFSIGSCTLKMKVEPQNKWTRRWSPAKAAWARSKKVLKLIGFDCEEEYRMKRADAKAHTGKLSPLERSRYEYQYPLLDWGMNLDDCINTIQDAGLPVPPKSACFLCPNQQPDEVEQLTPEERSRVILTEITAEPYNTKVHGLWRRPRKSDGRPGSITEYILQQGLPFVPLTDICTKIVLNPACKKARTGVTFQGPHLAKSLTQLLREHGHTVPRILVQDDGLPGVYYRESVREAPLSVEDKLHRELAFSV